MCVRCAQTDSFGVRRRTPLTPWKYVFMDHFPVCNSLKMYNHMILTTLYSAGYSRAPWTTPSQRRPRNEARCIDLCIFNKSPNGS